MKIEEIIIGRKVKSLIELAGVPIGTIGIIDEDYGAGIMIAWDLAKYPLPKDYKKYNGKPAFWPGQPLRDGFDKKTELQFLEAI